MEIPTVAKVTIIQFDPLIIEISKVDPTAHLAGKCAIQLPPSSINVTKLPFAELLDMPDAMVKSKLPFALTFDVPKREDCLKDFKITDLVGMVILQIKTYKNLWDEMKETLDKRKPLI